MRRVICGSLQTIIMLDVFQTVGAVQTLTAYGPLAYFYSFLSKQRPIVLWLLDINLITYSYLKPFPVPISVVSSEMHGTRFSRDFPVRVRMNGKGGESACFRTLQLWTISSPEFRQCKVATWLLMRRSCWTADRVNHSEVCFL